jgi:FAD/FMN-containing dehydrogenase
MVLKSGLPKLILLVEFDGDNPEEIRNRLRDTEARLKKSFRIKTRITSKEQELKKYWAIRRESFNLLRKKIKNLRTAPFIDDVIVRPETLSDFLPALYRILDRQRLIYTIAGHVGNGNFHIIPLMDLEDETERRKIEIISDEVCDLVKKFKGSLSAEHNDGLIRGPYLEKIYDEKIYEIFIRLKDVFDPLNIFNPRKKLRVTKEYAFSKIAE